MLSYSINGINYLQFPHLAAYSHLQHAIFTRIGGESPPPFDSLNIGFNVNDDSRNVQNNREKLLDVFQQKTLLASHQVHGNKVVRWTDADQQTLKASGPDVDPIINMGEADAIITGVINQPILIQTADCQAIMLFDPIQNVVGNVHSGWRGSLQNIAAQTVNMMKQHYNCNPTDILAGIGPSLGPCCAEFVNYQKEIPEMLWLYKNEHHHFDFWAISRDQLIETGLREQNIENSGLCSSCRTDLFFSYRKEKETGRFGSLISLTQSE